MDDFEAKVIALCKRSLKDDGRLIREFTDYYRGIFHEHCQVRPGTNEEIDVDRHKIVRYITPKFVFDTDDLDGGTVMVGTSKVSLLSNTILLPCSVPDLRLPLDDKLRQLFHSTALVMASTINQSKPAFLLEAPTPYLKLDAWNLEFFGWATCVLLR